MNETLKEVLANRIYASVNDLSNAEAKELAAIIDSHITARLTERLGVSDSERSTSLQSLQRVRALVKARPGEETFEAVRRALEEAQQDGAKNELEVWQKRMRKLLDGGE